MLSLTLTLGAKNRGKENNLKERIENRKKMRKELSPLFATLTNKPSLPNNILLRFLTIQLHYSVVRLPNVLAGVPLK